MKHIIAGVMLLLSLSLHGQAPALVSQINKLNGKNHLVYVPAVTRSGSDSSGLAVIRSTRSFYVSMYEVSNREYREFTDYVRDSTAHSLLGHFIPGRGVLDWKSP